MDGGAWAILGGMLFPNRRALTALVLVVLAAPLLLSTGCTGRLNRHAIVNRRAVEIDLVTVREGLFGTQARDFEHPAIISVDRMKNILGSLEVETAEGANRFIRKPAIHPAVVDEAAEALVKAFAEADPNSQLGVKLIRKEQQLGVFHNKFLTSFMAHMKDDHLYIVLSRIDWPIPQSKEKQSSKSGKLPEPQPGGSESGRFRVVSGEPLYYAGPFSVEVDWRSNAFRKPFRLPGSAKGGERRREVLFQSKGPAPSDAAGPDSGAGIGDLSPEQLRALATLEEDRRAGRLTETAYQRAKRDLLRKR